MPKTILYLCSGRGFSSSRLPRKIKEVIKCFYNSGHNIILICGDDIVNCKKKNKKNNNKEYEKYVFMDKKLSLFRNSASELRDIIHDRKLYHFLCRKLKNDKLSLIWERSSRLHSSGLRLAKKMNVPYVLEWKDHLINYKASLFRPLALSTESIKERYANFIVVESHRLKCLFVSRGFNKEKIVVAHNGVNADEFKPDDNKRSEIRNKYHIKDWEIVVGYVGSFSFYQDTIRMILAMNIIKKMHKPDIIKLHIFGKGEDYEKCENLAKEMGLLNKHIFMHGYVDQNRVPSIMNAFDIGLVPGTTDIICPIKVFEYMATGIPVILPDYECNREVINDKDEGLFFKPRDEYDMAKKLILLSEDDNLRREIGRAARLKVINKFTWEKTWQRALINILNKIN